MNNVLLPDAHQHQTVQPPPADVMMQRMAQMNQILQELESQISNNDLQVINQLVQTAMAQVEVAPL